MTINAPPREYLSPINLARRGIPRPYFNATLDQYEMETEIYEFFKNYLDNLHSMFSDCVGLICYGSNGTGKSFLSSLIVKEAYRLRYTSYLIQMQGLMDLHMDVISKEEDAKERLREVTECHFLVIDEVGKEVRGNKDYNINILENVLRKRFAKGFPTIICTNLNLDTFYSDYGASIASLLKGTTIQIEFVGKDFRHKVKYDLEGVKLLMGDDESSETPKLRKPRKPVFLKGKGD